MDSSFQRRLFCLGLSLLVLSPLACTKKTEAPVQKPSLATLQSVSNQVHFRRAHEDGWRAAEPALPLFRLDSVKTGGESSATLLFTNQTTVTMKENSLIMILESGTGPAAESSLTLRSGRLQGQVERRDQKDSEIVLKTNKAWVRARSTAEQAQVHFSAQYLSADRLEVRAQQGRLQIVSKERSKDLLQGEAVAISNLQPETETAAPAFEPPTAQESDWQFQKPGLDPEFFEFSSPSKSHRTKESHIRISGKMGESIDLIFRGKQIPAQKENFELSVPLKKGTNLLTFQIVNRKSDKVRYETLEIIQEE